MSEVDLLNKEQRERLFYATKVAACKLGLGKTDPVFLCQRRHSIIKLTRNSDHAIARIISTNDRDEASIKREMAITRFLDEKGVPVVAPHKDMPSEPYDVDGLLVTLWPYVEHQPVGYEDQAKTKEAAKVLQAIHTVLADYPGDLPLYTEKFDSCNASLEKPNSFPKLLEADRLFLLETSEQLKKAIEAHEITLSPIHGDAHMGNVFSTKNGLLWTDFEAACRGPYEWDAATLRCCSGFPKLNPETYKFASRLHSFCMVVWCSELAEDPEKDAAAQDHLERLKNSDSNCRHP